MTKLSIYQTIEELLTKSTILLIEKCYQSNLRTVVLTEDEEMQELLNKTLWVYSRKKFLPHGSRLDNNPEKQPIYITSKMENPNNAEVLLMMSLTHLEGLDNHEYIKLFHRIIIVHTSCIVLDEIISKANKLKSLEKPIDCYKQNLDNSWNKILPNC